MPLFSVDSYALRSRPIPLGKFINKNRLAKRFDAKTLGIIDINEHKKLYKNKLNCKCFVCKQRTLNDMLKVYNGAQLLKQALACHEACSSYNEFINSRRWIIKKEYKEYLRSKEHIYNPIKKFLKVDLKNKTIVS